MTTTMKTSLLERLDALLQQQADKLGKVGYDAREGILLLRQPLLETITAWAAELEGELSKAFAPIIEEAMTEALEEAARSVT